MRVAGGWERGDVQIATLARISHTLSAADADCGPSASLRSFGLLDVGSTTPSSASLRAPCIRATLCVLATRGCEKCGLGADTRSSFAMHSLSEVSRGGAATRRKDMTLFEPPRLRVRRSLDRKLTVTDISSHPLNVFTAYALSLNEEAMVAPDKPKLPVILSEGRGCGRERRIATRPVDLHQDLCGDPSRPPEPHPLAQDDRVGGFRLSTTTSVPPRGGAHAETRSDGFARGALRLSAPPRENGFHAKAA